MFTRGTAIPSTKTAPSTEQNESRRYDEDELDLIDEVPTPRMNPWLSMGLLFMLGFLYLWAWQIFLLGGR